MSLLRAALTVSGLTMVSRVLGFARDILMAAMLGAGGVADAFIVAFKLPNFFRRLFAEGAFNAAFVPIFSDLLPALDRLDRPAGLILATGFSGHGFGMGPIVGRLVSELALDGAPSLDLSAFRYARFHDGSKLVARGVV